MARYITSRCNDGGVYYISWFDAVGEGQSFAWVGLEPGGAFANVFFGRFPRSNQLQEIVHGEWWDVPFGSTSGHGELDVHIGTWGAGVARETGGFAGNTWDDLRQVSGDGVVRSIPLITRAGRTGSGLSGFWRSAESGAHYYIAQYADTVVWFAAREDLSAANVYKGIRRGDRVSGRWVDIPFGRTRERGIVNFRVVSDGPDEVLLRKDETSGVRSGYGTNNIVRLL